jgi:hypothetical protein
MNARMLVLLVVLAAAVPRSAGAAPKGLQITDDEIFALVHALKGKPIGPFEHDLLVALGEQVTTAPEALPGDLIFIGWGLVAVDRPELGYPILRDGLGRPPLLAADALRNVLLAVDYGQDSLARGIIDFASGINEAAARRLRRSIHLPQEFADATRTAKRHLKGLAVGQIELEDVGVGRRVSWFVAPDPLPDAPRVVLLLADPIRLDGLPRDCQSARRLKEAAAFARDGAVAVLPGLRGCDFSDGVYLGTVDAEADLGALIARLRSDFEPASIELYGSGVAGLLVLELADLGLAADRFVATEPRDPRVWTHLPEGMADARAEALTAATRRDGVEIVGSVDASERAGRRRRK